MSDAGLQQWHSANQSYLLARLAIVREMLRRYAREVHRVDSAETDSLDELTRRCEKAACALPAPAALDRLCGLFGLSDFERDVLLISAGCEMDRDLAALCGALAGRPGACAPTLGLVLGAFPRADWGALTPASPLRYWRLLEIGSEDTLTSSAIRVDERILHYLQGTSYLDARLRGSFEFMAPDADLSPSQQKSARELAACLERAEKSVASPVLQLCGTETTGKRIVAAAACAHLGVQLHVLHSSDLPSSAAERGALSRLWHREALLSNSALLIEHEDSNHEPAAQAFIERAPGMVLVASREPLALQRAAIRVDVSKPSPAEQRAIWQAALGDQSFRLNGHVPALTAQFDLSAAEIHAASVQALATADEHDDESFQAGVWSACRLQARRRIKELAQQLEPAAQWADLVLAPAQLQTLRDMVAQVRHRAKVYEEWGFATKGARGLGIGALFAGASGTGKTLAAEVIAGELQLDLYRIDLSQIVSKYIGETEKNLSRVFEAAQDSGAVLLFDEADALFGKRSDVKDSHDRYANIEVSYLLQRMEAYRGLAILTTNMMGQIDTAFLRRLRFIVQFPFPDGAQRMAIWRKVFPTSLPTVDLQPERLAQLNVSGGSIRNIALHASFYAAAEGEPVRMSHLLRAAQIECAKLEKSITAQEVRGWA